MKSKVQQRRATVLIIDDDKNDIVELTEILSQNFEIIIAEDGEKGLNILRTQISKISVVVMSGNLPIPNKYEYLQKIKNDPVLNFIPVVALVTRGNGTVYEHEWLDYGAIDYITKPLLPRLTVERLLNVVRYFETSTIVKALEHDELTGLLTREAFIHHANTYIARAPEKAYCILAVDVENFKTTNTQYGEERCDEFLAYIAGRLIAEIKTGFAGRFGGDQFVVLFEMKPELSAENIEEIKNRILEEAPIPKQVVNIGVYQPIDTKLPVVRCCDRAFLAIREIKGVYGKDLYYFEDKLQQQLLNEQRITDCMEKALEEEQFKVFYQPKHETVTGKIAGAEALIRWEHPEYGFMSPGQFIPLFEKNGFITQIDSFVMKKVCSDLIKWQQNGIPIVPISVNISRKDFFEPEWLDSHLKQIDEYGIDHSLLHLEVTESMYSENMEYIIEQVKKIQNQGYMIEMDDFGSGYSSLGLLSTFPLNVIKLDISFVRHIDVNEVVIENIIKMAHSMGFITVAEGAETDEQFKILKKLGCDLIQGYVFSKPLPSREFENYLRHNACTLEPLAAQLTLSSNGELNDALLKAANEVAEGLPGGFFTYHADGKHEIIALNNELLNIYECESAAEFRKLTGNAFDGMVYEEDLHTVLESIKEQIASGNHIGYQEYRIKCKNGKIKYIRDYGRLVHSDRMGDIIYVFLNDWTEEYNKRIEEKKINEVIQGISQTYSSIFLLDFETKKISPYAVADEIDETRGKIFNDISDYDEFVNVYADNFVKNQDKELLMQSANIENIKNVLADTNHFNFTYRLNEPFRGMNLVEMAFRKLKDENSQNRVVITFRPIAKSRIKVESEKNSSLIEEIEQYKRLEEDYKLDLKRAINKAETADKSRKVFIDNLTNSLLVVMSDIVSSMQLARENVDSKTVLMECLDKGQDAQERLSFIVNNVVKLTKTENGEIDINSVPTDVTPAIEKTKRVVQASADAKNIKLETYSEFINPYVYQDVTNTAEFVCAILFNAIKYTPVGGTVTFGLRQLPGETENECIVEFCCKDTGIGMSEDFIPHMFERFAREDNDINDRIPSPGIGLTIVKNILDVMGGTIEVQSELGKGTTIVVKTKHRYADKKDILQDEAYISSVIKK